MADLNVPGRTFFEGDSAEIDRQMRHESGIASIFDPDLIVLVCAESISPISADAELADPAHAELAAPRDRFLVPAPENLTD